MYRRLSTFSSSSFKLTERRNTGSLKLDRYGKLTGGSTLEYGSVLPLWVADCDYSSPQEIQTALKARVDHGVFGYPMPSEADHLVVLNYLQRQHGLRNRRKEEVVFLPGLVVGLNVAAKAFAGPGDAVMTCVPVYPPFCSAPITQGRASARVALVKDVRGRDVFDFEGMRVRVDESPHLPRVKAFFVCNPHNPVGRVFTKEEVVRLLEFCAKREIVVVSDEVHSDIILDENVKHTSSLGLGFDDFVVMLNAPSKTYNVAGLGAAFAVIPNPKLRAQFKSDMRGIVVDINIFGLVAMRTAYSDPGCEEWRDGLLRYLRNNLKILDRELQIRIPRIRFDASKHQATFLAWLDCTDLIKDFPTEDMSASDFFLKHGEIAFNDGKQFYADPSFGKQFVRLNFGCDEYTLMEAIKRMEIAVNSLGKGKR